MARGHKKKPRREKARLTPQQQRAVEQAREFGLCPVFEVKFGQPLWLIHRLDDGRCVGFWNPASGRYKLRGETGITMDRREAFRIAAGRPAAEAS